MVEHLRQSSTSSASRAHAVNNLKDVSVDLPNVG